MAWIDDINNLELDARDGPGVGVWKLWKGLIAAGWTPMGSGDGIATFENNGQTGGPYDVLSVDPSGGNWNNLVANGFSNTGAWWRAQMPGSTLEIAIKRSTASSGSGKDDFMVGIAPSGFTDNNADANNPPTGATQEAILGSLWSTPSVLVDTDNDQRIHVRTRDDAVDGVYQFALVYMDSSTQDSNGGFWFAAVDEPSVGDPQPWVIKAGNNAYKTTGLASAKGYYDFGGGGQVFTTMGAPLWGSLTTSASVAPDGDGRSLPMLHGSGTGLWKGFNNIMRWKGVGARNYPDTVNLATADAHVVLTDCILEWPQGVAPL